MSQPHLINSMLVLLDFDNPKMGDAFQAEAASFVKNRLLPIADKIFDQAVIGDEVISIDNLEIDLGDISVQDYVTQFKGKLEGKFEAALKKKLSEVIPRSPTIENFKPSHSLQANQTVKSTDNASRKLKRNAGVTIMSAEGSLLKQLEFYLIRGIIPWNFNNFTDANKTEKTDTTGTELTTKNWLDNVVSQHIDVILLLLRDNTTKAEVIINRLFHQLSPALLNTLALKLHFSEQAILIELLNKSPSSNNSAALQEFLDLYWLQFISQHINNGSISNLEQVWPMLINQHGRLVLKTLIQYGQQSNIRHFIAHKFSATMLFDIIELLEPMESHFILQLLKQSDVFNEPKTKRELNVGHDNLTTKAQLGEFTLTYLIVERGSRFNRLSYLASVIKKMAAHYNINQHNMLNALSNAVEISPENSGLSAVIGDILTDVTPMLSDKKISSDLTLATKNEPRNPVAENSTLAFKDALTRQITLALNTGKVDPIVDQWALIVHEYPSLLLQLLTHYGKNEETRRKFVRGFSDVMLKGIVAILAPTQHIFIQQIIDHSSNIFTADSSNSTDESQKHQVLDFTFSYLLVNRGSEFNKISYLGALVNKMAAHSNIEYGHLLLSLYRTMISFSGSVALKQTLNKVLLTLIKAEDIDHSQTELNDSHQSNIANNPILPYLSAESRLAAIAITDQFSDPNVFNKLVEMLYQGNDQALSTYWQQLLTTYEDLFTDILLHQGKLALVRHNIVIGFNESKLIDIIELLAPRAKTFILALLDNVSLFSATENGQSNEGAKYKINNTQQVSSSLNKLVIKENLWEFTLTYLLVERGTGFNNKSYLASLIRQMSAHRNMNHNDLLIIMIHSIGINGLTGSLKSEILLLLEQLKEAESNSTFDNQNKASPHKFNSAQPETPLQILSSYDQYLALKAYLSGQTLLVTQENSQYWPDKQSAPNKGLSSAAHFILCLKTLSQHSPILLQRLLKESQTGQINWQKVVGLLSTEQITLLIRTFLSLNYVQLTGDVNSYGAANTSRFIQSISTFTQTWSEPNKVQLFFVGILKAIAANLAIDFSQISQEIDHSNVNIETATDISTDVTSAVIPTQQVKQDQEQAELISAPELSPEQWLTQFFAQQNSPSSNEQYLISKNVNKLITTVEYLLLANTSTLKTLMLQGIQSHRNIADLLMHLPERLLIRLLLLLQPTEYTALQTYARLITQACYLNITFSSKLTGANTKTTVSAEQIQYQYIFKYLIVEGRPFKVKPFVNEFIAYLTLNSTISGALDNAQSSAQKNVTSQVLSQLKSSHLPAEQATKNSIVTIIESIAKESLIKVSAATDINQTVPTTVKKIANDKSLIQAENDQKNEQSNPLIFNKEDTLQPGEQITISNAGLVLAAPYIPRLFDMLNVVEKGAFKEPQDAHKGMHLLQYLVNSTNQTPEYQMVLNKVLCGIPTNTPVPYEVDITAQEKTTVTGMLQAIIQHWTSLGKTSIEGLQQTFLQREGVLVREEESWSLTVQPATFDMLLDQLPWSFSLIKYPWMEQPLHVHWR